MDDLLSNLDMNPWDGVGWGGGGEKYTYLDLNGWIQVSQS